MQTNIAPALSQSTFYRFLPFLLFTFHNPLHDLICLPSLVPESVGSGHLYLHLYFWLFPQSGVVLATPILTCLAYNYLSVPLLPSVA